MVIAMFIKADFHRFTAALLSLAIIIICTLLLIFSRECADGALSGIEMCINVLIPSLFPFMAVSSFIVKSGISHTLGRPFAKIMRFVFGLSPCFAPVLLLSVTGGYPIGAKSCGELYKSGNADTDECKRACMFMVCAGPGFMISFIGMSVYNDKKIGVIMLCSQIFSVIISGIANRIINRGKISPKKSESKKIRLSLTKALVESVADASGGMLSICSFVIFFSAVAGILTAVINDGFVKTAVLGALEVCTGIKAVSAEMPVWAAAFVAGFGGICVHFQIFSVLGGLKISRIKFFLYRIIQGCITALLTYFGMLMFYDARSVFSVGTVTGSSVYGGTALSGIALTLLMICFLFSVKNCRNN